MGFLDPGIKINSFNGQSFLPPDCEICPFKLEYSKLFNNLIIVIVWFFYINFPVSISSAKKFLFKEHLCQIVCSFFSYGHFISIIPTTHFKHDSINSSSKKMKLWRNNKINILYWNLPTTFLMMLFRISSAGLCLIFSSMMQACDSCWW